jgi:hypothetical protein
MTDRPVRESDQLPEEQPEPAVPGTDDPERRERDVGVDDAGGPHDRRNTGNERDDAAAAG